MSAGGHGAGPEMARGLSQILTQALTTPGGLRTLDDARVLARMFSLRGLDRVLATLATHGGHPWPAALRPTVDRLLAASNEAARTENVEAFRRMEEDLDRTAAAIDAAARRRTAPPAHGAQPVRLAEVLSGLEVKRGADLLQRVRLEPLVAAAFRAALDWLLDDGETRRPLALECDGSALEAQCEGIQFTGLEPAAEVLGGVGAHVGPSGEPGVWSLKVPVSGGRETFLMIEQDELGLALPWHAVVRVRLVPGDAIEAMARRQGLVVLPALARDPRQPVEQPVVIVALGLKRACLTADRLVWRMAAEPAAPAEPPPVAALTRAVRTDDGELYWVLDPEWLLRDVAPVPFAIPRTRPAMPAAAETPPSVTPAAPPPIPFRLPAEAMRELGPEHVEPIEAAPRTAPAPGTPPAAVPPPQVTSPGAAGSPVPAPVAPPASALPEATAIPTPPGPAAEPAPDAAPAPARRQALIAEDSISARVFLARLLEQRGYTVHAVASARDLLALLDHGPWALVCADVDLPDARGVEVLAEAGRTLRGAARLIALVRDRADEAIARAAGVDATLRKPFEPAALDTVLARGTPDAPRGGRT